MQAGNDAEGRAGNAPLHGVTGGSARQPVRPADLIDAARLVRETFAPVADRDWGRRAGDLDWDCRRTLDHISDSLVFYAVHLALRADHRLLPVRNGDPERAPIDLLAVLASSAGLLAWLADAAPPGTRAFHPAGMADAEGFLALGCEEVLLHAYDIGEGLGVPFRPPDALAARVTRRIFPWAPDDTAPWDALRWAGGRIALAARDRLGTDWYWHCAPLSEWDGTVKKRMAPPGWR